MKPINLTFKTANEMFLQWYKKNSSRFANSVELKKPRKSYRRGREAIRGYTFNGIIEDINFTVEGRTLRTHADLEGKHYDSFCDFEINPARLPDGKFICADCVYWVESYQKMSKIEKAKHRKPTIPKKFNTLDDLYADHCFEKLLKWSNKNLKKGNVLIYDGEIDHVSMALIKPASAVLTMPRPMLVVPVIPPEIKGPRHRFGWSL